MTVEKIRTAEKPVELSENALDDAAGGFNPQPDPPGKTKLESINPSSLSAARGIIIVGG